MGSDGQIGGGWVRVVGYSGGWVEMLMGESVVVGGSAGGRIGDGELVVVPISVLICFCLCFSVLMVDSTVVVIFFFSW